MCPALNQDKFQSKKNADPIRDHPYRSGREISLSHISDTSTERCVDWRPENIVQDNIHSPSITTADHMSPPSSYIFQVSMMPTP